MTRQDWRNTRFCLVAALASTAVCAVVIHGIPFLIRLMVG